MGLIIGSANRQETFSDKAEPKKDQEFLVKMELQTFTFFLLAFVALTDGAPRDMDNSIDMTKPDNAKADLARGRRQEPGGFEPIDIESEEAQMANQVAMDWFHDRYGEGLVFHFKSAEKQLWFHLNMLV